MTAGPLVDLSGRVALVTGAAGGQGAAEARLFHALGARVVVADIAVDRAKAVAGELGDGRARAVRLDVGSEDDWRAVVAGVAADWGPIDVLVNNAAILKMGDIADSPLTDFWDTVRVNQFGVFLGMRSVIAGMTGLRRGSIVNISSSSAYWPARGCAAYSGAKSAVITMTRIAAMEFGPAGVRVNAILPGGIQTEMAAPGGAVPPFFRTIPTGRMGRPDEIAQLAAFLASDASSYCTGSAFVADGGWNAGNLPSGQMSPRDE